jgi:hypothetical protein
MVGVVISMARLSLSLDQTVAVPAQVRICLSMWRDGPVTLTYPARRFYRLKHLSQIGNLQINLLLPTFTEKAAVGTPLAAVNIGIRQLFGLERTREMHWLGTAFISRKQEQRLRKFQRTCEFAAGLLARDDHSEPLNCLIRNISPDGAQIRVNAAQSVPEQGYMINLKTRSAYHAHTVWRRGSLTGLGLSSECAISEMMPAHLEFLRSLFIEAKVCQVDQLTAEGIGREAALHKCDITEELYRRGRATFSA